MTLGIINIIGMIFEFLLFQSYSYMLMLIILCILFGCNVLIQFIHSIRNKVDMLVLILTIFIAVLNCYYLFHHLMMCKQLDTWYFNGAFDRMIEEMINISQTNIICFIMWFIPLGILIIQELIFNHKETENITKP